MASSRLTGQPSCQGKRKIGGESWEWDGDSSDVSGSPLSRSQTTGEGTASGTWLSSPSSPTGYRGPKPGTLRKQSILTELAAITRHTQSTKKQWEMNNWTYTGDFKENMDENLFPKGYGLYLMSKSTATDEAEFIKNVRHSIIAVPSYEIQDGLLSFLEDYLVQSECVNNAARVREDMLTSVTDWLQTEGASLSKIDGVHVDGALEAEEGLRDSFQPTMNMIERLATLRKQNTMLERVKKDQQTKTALSNETMSEVDLMGGHTEETSETAGSSICQTVSKPIEELKSIVEHVKDKTNKDVVRTVGKMLDDISGKFITNETDIKKSRIQLRERSEEVKKMQTNVNIMKKYNEQLTAQIQELRERQEAGAAMASAMMTHKRTSSTFQDCGSQVSMDAQPKETVGVLKDAVSAEVNDAARFGKRRSSKGAKHIKFRTDVQPPAELHVETRDSETEAAVYPFASPPSPSSSCSVESGSQKGKKHKLKPNSPLSKSSSAVKVKGRKKMKEVGKSDTDDQSEEPAELTKKEAVKVAVEKWKVANKKHRERPESPRDFSVDDVSLDIDHERLRQLAYNHITKMAALAQPFMHELMALRRNARREVERIKDRELTMLELEKKISEFLNTAPAEKDNLPVIDFDFETKKKVQVTNRVPESHRCALCMCHETTAMSVDTSSVKSRTLQKRAVAAAKEYREVLEKMRESYAYICNTVSQGHRSITHTLTNLVWGELGTTDMSLLSEEVDVKTITEVMTLKSMPTNLRELIPHALLATDTVFKLVKDTVAILHNAYSRMTDVRNQNEELTELERNLGLARACMDDNVLQLTRLRAGTELLRNGMVLSMSRCHCCRCYNSSLDDGTRVVQTNNVETKNRLVMTRNLSLLQQAIGGMLRATNEGENQLVIGADAQVIEGLQNVQAKLSDALLCMTTLQQQSEEEMNEEQ